MGWFKRKEPAKKWTDFSLCDQCQECSYVSDALPFRDGVCPKCGSMESHKVVARFLVSWLSYGLISVRATHDTEVRDNTERKLTDAQLRRARDMLSHFTS